GDMQVDARLRAGDVDGPAVYIGKLTNEDGSAYAGQILVTDTENVPWFSVTTGNDGTGHLQIGRPGNYPNRLTLDVTATGSTLVYDGLAYLSGGAITGELTVSGSVVAGENNVVLDARGVRVRVDDLSNLSDFNRYQLVTQADEVLSWVGGYYNASVNSMILQVDSRYKTRNATGSFQVISDAGYAAEANIAAVQNSVSASVSVQFDTSGNSAAVLNANKVRISQTYTPASAAATGTTGTIAWDTGYIYICTASNTWKRATLATW
ncbi:MAG: hypothetical protein KDI12_18155, partial [Anaerolineae bacterium]|nr:hypothetical protein [Anaerolineae bacterium]